jgi:putative membrane protein
MSTPPDSGRSNRTRDHLANERTYLAWVRTSLGLIGLGFVLARMGLFLRQMAMETTGAAARPVKSAHEYMVVGVVFLIFGIAMTGGAAWLHDRNRRAIESDRYEPSRITVFGLAAVVIAAGLLIVALVVWRTSLGTD